MPDWQLTNVVDGQAPECDAVRGWLREFNLAANPPFMELVQRPQNEARPLVVIATDDSGVVGGLLAETQLAWLKVSIMAVAPKRRSQGIGAALLAEAEHQAITRGCRRAYVDTMEYQAPQFYVKQGYEIVGRLEDWDSHSHAKLFLTKLLSV